MDTKVGNTAGCPVFAEGSPGLGELCADRACAAVTIFFVLHDFGERTQRAALDAELLNSERFADVLSSRLVGLQTSMRSAVTHLSIDDLDDTDALISFLDQNVVLRTMLGDVFISASDGRLLVDANEKGM